MLCFTVCPAAVGLPVVLYFRVKYYVPDPAMLREEFTRYLFVLILVSVDSTQTLVSWFLY